MREKADANLVIAEAAMTGTAAPGTGIETGADEGPGRAAPEGTPTGKTGTPGGARTGAALTEAATPTGTEAATTGVATIEGDLRPGTITQTLLEATLPSTSTRHP